MTINGIDVSTFQGAINWEKVKKYNDVQFAMIRGGYGRFELDERFIQNYNNCKAVGIPVGIYHYSYATTMNKARQEAEFVISYLKDKKLEYPVAYDVEDQTLSTLSGKKLTDIVDTFCSTLEKAGYYVVIYSGKYWFAKMNMKRLSRYDIWLAQ
jgi:GH25 family lysozyme M1 (1,4-beta-N-acetylmuramidase)